MTTPEDSAAVTQETALILHDLEYLRRITDEGICAHIIDAAILAADTEGRKDE